MRSLNELYEGLIILRTFVINLRTAVDRRAFISKRMRELGLEFEFFEATDGRVSQPDLPIAYSADPSRRRLARALGPGEIGCFSSHYRLWLRCVELREPLLILEDDVELSGRLPAILPKLEILAKEHGVVRLAGRERNGTIIGNVDDAHAIVRFPRGIIGTLGYVVDPSAANVLLEGAKQWADPVDSYLDRFWVHGVEIVGLTPFLVSHSRQLEAGSTIAADRRGKLRGATKIRREIVRMGDEAQRIWANARALPRLAGLPRYRPG